MELLLRFLIDISHSIALTEAGMPSPEWTKRKKQTLKIGHGGTLDSAARGVLGKRYEWKFDVTTTYYRKKYRLRTDKAMPF